MVPAKYRWKYDASHRIVRFLVGSHRGSHSYFYMLYWLHTRFSDCAGVLTDCVHILLMLVGSMVAYRSVSKWEYCVLGMPSSAILIIIYLKIKEIKKCNPNGY